MTSPDAQALLLPRRRERIERVVAARTRSLTLVLDQLRDPHNLSAILRTCEGFGIQEVHAVVSGRHGFRATPRITQGAEKWLDLTYYRSMTECAAALKARGFLFCVTDLEEGTVPLHALPMEKPLALVMGNEVDGVSDEARELADHRFAIPMLGFAQSYNVSVTAAVCVALVRERRRQQGVVGDLTPLEAASLRQRFFELAVKQGDKIFPEG
jgi:tRNA (guanosine-2'-O-)-methyltransferase